MIRIPIPAWLQPAVAWIAILRDYMTAREKAVLTVLLLVLITSAVFSVTGYVRRNSHIVPEAGGGYVEAAVGQPRYINPILASASDLDLDLTSLVYSPLFKLNNNFEIAPSLATHYETSEDQLTYTIYLRPGVKWHDGQPFTADDVIFTIRSIQTPDYGSPLQSSFQGVTADKVDDMTIQFKLTQPYAPFLNNLTIGIAPKHVWESITPKNAALAEQMLKPVGTGSFKFSEIVTRRRTGEITSYQLVRNEEYFGPKPHLDEITFVFFPTQQEATAALLANNVDGVGFLPLTSTADVNSRSALRIRRILLPQYFGLFFNEIKNETLGNAGVRSALALATDRQAIIDQALHGYAKPLHAPIPSGVYDFNDNFPSPVHDPEIAKQNLEEAGWKDENADGVREKDGKNLEVTITTTDWAEFVATAELLKTQWEAVGARVNIQSFGAGVIQQTVVGPRDYEILLYGEILAIDPDPYPFWHSTQTRSPGLNLALVKDTQIDKLLETARKTSNKDEREASYVKFQERFLDLNPAIILYQPYYLVAHHRSVRGQTVEYVNLPSGRFNDIENWHVNVKRVWN